MLECGALPAPLGQSPALESEMTMQAALMVPCYIDMFYPHVGIATLELLEKLDLFGFHQQEC